jgi:Holliday junction resolvase RusA-like endonuclease
MSVSKPRLVFTIPGPPQPCERARVVSRVGRGRDGRPKAFSHSFTPDKTASYEKHVAMVTQVAVAQNPEWKVVVASEAHLRVTLHFVRLVDRGDLDNHCKSVLDGMNEIAWADDRLVRQTVASVETWPKEPPHVQVIVEPIYGPLQEPLWMRIARENGWVPAPPAELRSA